MWGEAMSVKWVYGIFPAFIKYTEKVSYGRAGTANMMFIRILPDARDDVGLLNHEMTHVRQWYRTIGLHTLLYAWSERYRLSAEAEAYAVQVLSYPEDDSQKANRRIDLFARFISTTYDLHITEAEARDRIMSKIGGMI